MLMPDNNTKSILQAFIYIVGVRESDSFNEALCYMASFIECPLIIKSLA